MHKNSFMAAVKRAVSKEFPDCSVESVTTTKNNNVRLKGISISPHGSAISPAVYTDHYFSALKSGCPLETVIENIKNDCRMALGSAAMGIGQDFVKDFHAVKDNICYRLVSKKLNGELLSSIPHREFHDLAVTYYLQLDVTDYGSSTVDITDSLAQIWGVDEAQLYGLAQENTPRLHRGIVMTMWDVLYDTMEPGTLHGIGTDGYGCFDFSRSRPDILPMYVATNVSKTYGSAVILYDGLLNAVAEKIGSFYALPSSIHEFICVPDTVGGPEEITGMVSDINTAEVHPEEVLSENIYHFNAEKHEFGTVS